MKIPILIISILFFISNNLFSQKANDNVLYIVDSIVVKYNPEPGDEINPNDVSAVTVVKNKDSLKTLGYEKFDGVIYIFTKEYISRPYSLKLIPSTKQMERKEGIWYYRGIVYNGRFIDYYYSGKKQGEGNLVNGKVDGVRRMYLQNGNLSLNRNYTNGIAHGLDIEYYDDGTLKQKGIFINGKEEGIWEDYYPNGKVKRHSIFKKGELIDSAYTYYSNGNIKEKYLIVKGKVVPDPSRYKIEKLMDKSSESYKDGDMKAAINYCTKAIKLDSTYADAFYSRATNKLNNFQFDEAIADFDKALSIEPFMETALANRAFARIRKYELGEGRKLMSNSEVTVLATKKDVKIPQEDLVKICNDLKQAVFLGDKAKMINEAISKYCKD